MRELPSDGRSHDTDELPVSSDAVVSDLIQRQQNLPAGMSASGAAAHPHAATEDAVAFTIEQVTPSDCF